MLLVAERDEQTRAFLLDNLAADGYEPVGAQTEEETRVKFRNHGPTLVLLGGLGEDRPVGRSQRPAIAPAAPLRRLSASLRLRESRAAI